MSAQHRKWVEEQADADKPRAGADAPTVAAVQPSPFVN